MAISKEEIEARNKKITDAIRSGRSVESVASEYGLSDRRIENISYEYGASLRGRWSCAKWTTRAANMPPMELVKWIEGQCESGPNGCLLWTRAKLNGGYGTISINDKTILVHRAVFQCYNKTTLPRSQCVCHRCDVRNCVNIEHLFLGSIVGNTADMDAKGRRRSPNGEDLPQSKLRGQDVVRIKQMLKSGMSSREIHKEFNSVHLHTIRSIEYGNNWKHIIVD